MPLRSISVSLFFFLATFSAFSQILDSDSLGGLSARAIGPGAMGGRIADMTAVSTGQRLTIYVGAASGGVWKSVDSGTVLASGDQLVATARDSRRLDDLVKQHGDRVRTAPLDMADEAAAYGAVHVAVEAFGRLDVVVNNAGDGDVGHRSSS